MKHILITTVIVFLGLSAFSNQVQALGQSFLENEKGNGGDTCEARIQEIRNDIRSWIRKGGANDLKLPASVSLNQYKKSMLKSLSQSQISCVDRRIIISGVEKTCKNHQGLIECNINRFQNRTNEEEQYQLIHHEYAGVAGFEVNQGSESDYFISQQITSYLETQVIKRLAVKGRENDILHSCKNADMQIVVTGSDLPFEDEWGISNHNFIMQSLDNNIKVHVIEEGFTLIYDVVAGVSDGAGQFSYQAFEREGDSSLVPLKMKASFYFEHEGNCLEGGVHSLKSGRWYNFSACWGDESDRMMCSEV